MRFINQDYLATKMQGRAFRKGGGKGDGGGSDIDPRIVEMAQKGTFKPFTISTSFGQGFGREGAFGSSLATPQTQAQQGAVSGLNQLLPQISGQAARQPGQLDFGFNLDEATQRNFQEQSALLDPAFAQQRSQLKSDLFGSGRLGLQLAGQGVGAGEGSGMVQPDAFGLARAQSQTLADVAGQSRQRALGEMGQQFGMQQQQLTTNEALQNQRLQGLLGGSQGLFGIGSGLSQQELAMLELGLRGEQMRGASYADASRALAAGQVQEQDDGGKGLLGSAIGAAGNVGAAGVTSGAWLGSDKRLKKNIIKLGKTSKGYNFYRWDWNDIAKSIGWDIYPTTGVLAQEVVESAKVLDSSGYYKVKYNEVM